MNGRTTMGRRVRANGGSRPLKSGSVVVSHIERKLKKGWTIEQALDLLAQGYSDEQVAHKTGLGVEWVRRQPIPRTTLLERAKAGQTGPRSS